MTLSLIKPGGWAFGDLLDEDQMNDLQDELIKAIDGVDGGSYTLGGVLTVGGANIHFTGNVFVDDDLLLGTGGSTTVTAGHTVHIQAIENLVVDSESVTLTLPLIPISDGGAGWAYNTGGGALHPFGGQENLITGRTVIFALPVNIGDVITSIVADVIGGASAGHGGVDPTNKMRLSLLRHQGVGGGAVGALTQLVDPATGAAYDVSHTITISPAETVIDRQYFVAVRAESGGTAAANENGIERIRVTITRNKLVSTNSFGT